MGAHGKKMPRRMFIERMKREGRIKEFNTAGKLLMKEKGLDWNRAAYETMVAWGYDPETETVLHTRYLQEQEAQKYRQIEDKRHKQVVAEAKIIQEERKMESWAEVIRRLPPAVAHAKEIDWVGSHEAMTRKKRQRDPEKTISIDSVNDLIGCANGDCPSQRAANILVTYANNPDKFYNEIMGQMKKSEGAEEVEKGVVEDPGIEEIERMLKEIEG